MSRSTHRSAKRCYASRPRAAGHDVKNHTATVRHKPVFKLLTPSVTLERHACLERVVWVEQVPRLHLAVSLDLWASPSCTHQSSR
jgi:hypothetical protein